MRISVSLTRRRSSKSVLFLPSHSQPSCADGVIIQVTTSDMHFKNKVTPYENKTLHGRVCETWLRGWKIYSIDTGFDKGGPGGELLVDRREHLN
jgi:hypothetical protein